MHASSEGCLALPQVLGVWMVAAEAPEILQGVAVALKAGATWSHFRSTVGIHPTAAEEMVNLHQPQRRFQCRGGP